MQAPHLVESTNIYVGRWASGSVYVEMADTIGDEGDAFHVNLHYGPDSDLWAVVDDIARLLVAWAELGPLGIATAHGRILRGEH